MPSSEKEKLSYTRRLQIKLKTNLLDFKNRTFLKELRILDAIQQNNVARLKTLLDSPSLYKITYKRESTLLQVAILEDKKEVFDYLLSLPDYPLELVDAEGHTALKTALTARVNHSEDVRIKEYYAHKLIEKGADIHRASDHGANFLHDALRQNSIGIAKALVGRGIDVNKQDSSGNTPFHVCCRDCRSAELVEGVAVLLYHGADPLVRNFTGLTPLDMILRSTNLLTARENLFYYIFDQFTRCDIDAEAFLRAAQLDSSIFFEIMKHTRRVVFNGDFPRDLITVLFMMKTQHLQILVKRFYDVVEKLLQTSPQYVVNLQDKPISIDNFFLLMKSRLRWKFADWLSGLDIEGDNWEVLDSTNSKSSVQEFIFLILSYGSRVSRLDSEKLFRKFGSYKNAYSNRRLLNSEDERMRQQGRFDEVERDGMYALRCLIDSPRWYKVKGHNRRVVREDRREVFNFLLHYVDFPLELVNSERQSALIAAMTESINVGGVDSPQTDFLHVALEMGSVNIAKVLVEKGVDVNKPDHMGNTPLHVCCVHCKGLNLVEGVAILLYHGADPLIRNLEGLSPLEVILRSTKEDILTAQENLFYYTFDRYTECDIDAEAFLRASALDSLIFYEITKYVRRVVFSGGNLSCDFTPMLFTMKTHYLQIIIDKFDYVVEELLRISPQYVFTSSNKQIFVDNFLLLMKSRLGSKFARWLSRVHLEDIFGSVLKFDNSESSMVEFVLLMLSYDGSRVSEFDLGKIYERFGYSELFKILLHMDVEKEVFAKPMEDLMASILYKVTLDVPKMIKRPDLLPRHFEKQLNKVLPYYTVPSYQPRVPLLVELARDVFRRYFVEMFDIKNARQFYTFVALLPICTYHKEIITLEQKLY